MTNDIKKHLNKVRVNSLTQQEKNAVWKQVCLGMAVTPKKSHKIKISSLFKKSMALTLIFGMTMGTASAANEAKPGDILFPLDRAMENAHLYIVSNGKKDDLKVKFALERVEEVKEIFSEISTKTIITEVRAEEEKPENEETLSETPLEPTEITQTPKVETDKEDSVPEKSATNPSGDNGTTTVADELTESSDEEPLTPEEVTTASSSEQKSLKNEETETLEISDSTPLENGSTTEDIPEEEEEEEVQKINVVSVEMSDVDKKRIELALGTALDFLGDVKGELSEQGNDAAALSIDNLLKDLNTEIGTLPENITFEVKLSPNKQKVQFEITSEDDKETVQLIKTAAEKVVEIKEVEPSEQPEEEAIESETVEPKEPKLEIKDGILTINKNEPTPPTEEDGEVSEEETKPASAEGSGEAKKEENATTTEDVSDKIPTVKIEEENGTTTVKVIIKKLDEDINFSITDQDGDFHEIIEEYTDKKEEA